MAHGSAVDDTLFQQAISNGSDVSFFHSVKDAAAQVPMASKDAEKCFRVRDTLFVCNFLHGWLCAKLTSQVMKASLVQKSVSFLPHHTSLEVIAHLVKGGEPKHICAHALSELLLHSKLCSFCLPKTDISQTASNAGSES